MNIWKNPSSTESLGLSIGFWNWVKANETMIKIYRQRLTDLSWLMKSISEPIARRANAEDKVNGRFWKG